MVGLARGHRRIGGKQLGHMEPLSLAEVMVAEGKRYDKIAVSRVVNPHYALKSDLTKTVVLSCCASLADVLTRPGISDERIFHLLVETAEAFDHMGSDVSRDRAELLYGWFALRLLDILGHVASFGSCVVCRGELGGDVCAVPQLGGGVCDTCARSVEHESERVEALGWKLLRVLHGASCEDVIFLTASKQHFRSANRYVSDVLQTIPADGEPHGYKTIDGILRRLFSEVSTNPEPAR